ncbi:MAG: alkaline phosphatase [Verrucomicrobiota bacterium]
MSRRKLLGLTTSGAALAAAPFISCSQRKTDIPSNIIFMVADGMSLGVPSLVEPFSRMLKQKGTQWHSIARRPQTTHGFFDMASLNSLVTDSSAASSSWGSGSRVNNRAVNTLPDGTKLKPIGHIAKEAGYRVGLVTTTRLTHATPAGFLSSTPHRNREDEIATQYLGYGDVLMGGGLRHFDGSKRKDNLDLTSKYKQQGFQVIKNRNELKNLNQNQVLGLFSNSHLPYSLDLLQSEKQQSQVPTLAEMTQAALKILASKPFLLQIEAGRVDHAAHANDAAALLHEQLAFDDAIEVAKHFADERNDTLVVITTDHGNANPGLNGYGDGYTQTNSHFERILKIKESFAMMQQDLKTIFKAKGVVPKTEVLDRVLTGSSIELSSIEAGKLADTFQIQLQVNQFDWNQQHGNFTGLLGQMLGNHVGIQWTGATHTADLAPLMAIGPGRERFNGLLRNTEAFKILSQFMGSNYRNPRSTQ